VNRTRHELAALERAQRWRGEFLMEGKRVAALQRELAKAKARHTRATGYYVRALEALATLPPVVQCDHRIPDAMVEHLGGEKYVRPEKRSLSRD